MSCPPGHLTETEDQTIYFLAKYVAGACCGKLVHVTSLVQSILPLYLPTKLDPCGDQKYVFLFLLEIQMFLPVGLHVQYISISFYFILLSIHTYYSRYT